MMMIDDIKNTKYTINTPDGPQERNCVVALAKSSPLVKSGYDSCVNAFQYVQYVTVLELTVKAI